MALHFPTYYRFSIYLFFLQLSLKSLCFSQAHLPLRIGNITVDRREIFDLRDSSDDHFLGRFANNIHFLTNEQVIRRELLFQEGDNYNEDLIRESERNLRRMGFIGDISIRPVNFRYDSVDVVVQTQDKWTLNFSVSYKQDGGIQRSSSSLSEDNFLGYAQHLYIGYNYISDRNNPNGVELRYAEPRLFGSRWGTVIQYKNSEDLRIKTLLFEHPFYSENSQWAAALYAEDGIHRMREFENGSATIEEFVPRSNISGLWALSSEGIFRFRFGMAFSRVRSETRILSSPTENIDMMNLSFGLINRTFYQAQYLDNFGRVEDVPLGYLLNFVVGKNFYHAFPNSPDYFLQLKTQYSSGDKKFHYASFSFLASSYFASSQALNTSLHFSLIHHTKLATNNLFVTKVEYLRGFNWSRGRQLLLGSPSGLRGYPAHQFSGENLILLNLENRLLPNVDLWFFRLGFVFFIDYGTVWKDAESFSTRSLHGGIGLGLRLENTKQQGSGIIRIDFPLNLDNGKIFEIIISTEQLFSAFSSLETP